MLLDDARPGGSRAPGEYDAVQGFECQRADGGPGAVKVADARGHQVQQVGVQGITFDPAVQAISRSVSMGVPIETALRHVEQLSFVKALRQNKNAHVILDQATMGGGVGDGGMLNLAMRGAARRFPEAHRVNPYPPAEMRRDGRDIVLRDGETACLFWRYQHKWT